MISDWLIVLPWWLMLTGIGVMAFPLVWRLLGRLPDGGWGVSIVAGTVSAGWMTWMLSSLHLVPFEWWSGVLSLLVVTGIGWKIILVKRKQLKRFIRGNWRLLVGEWLLFSLVLFGWSFVRGFQPDINGLEKFMDAGFVASTLRASWMPPLDMWLAGKTINYYYFGHYLAAFLTKLSGLDLAYTYNLMLATIAAWSVLGGFSLIYNFMESSLARGVGGKKEALIGGLMGTALLNFGGNLHTAWHFLTRQTKGYWYPDATRFIPFTIHEFPAYSHVVADLHGHMMDLPIVLLFLTVLIGLAGSAGRKVDKKEKNDWLVFPVVVGFLLGVMYMTNAWDLPIYGLVFGLVLAGIHWPGDRSEGRRFLLPVLTGGVVSLAVAGLASLPFHLHFANFAQGVALVETRSPVWQLIVLWGGFGVIGAIAVWDFILKKRLSLLKLAAGAMVGVSLLLVILPEVIYVKDIYIRDYHRANTMFKLTYQAFVMMCLVFGITIGKVIAERKKVKGRRQRGVALFLLLLVFGAQMMYPFFSIKSYYGLTEYKGIFGLGWMVRSYSDDYAVLGWMKKNVGGQPVILEAVGESYTDHGRISAFSGLPTVLGWRVHEWLWRGGFEIPGKRTEEVKIMFEQPTSFQASELFNKYQVKYVFLGELERKAYQINDLNWRSMGRVVFQSGETKLVGIGQ